MRIIRCFILILVLPLALWAQGEPIKLARDVALSPDGKMIAFAWRDDIWTASTAGGAATRLTQHEGAERTPRFSPDGKQIAFVASREGSAQIYVMPTTGGKAKRVTLNTNGYSLLEWTPDGTGFLVRANRDHFWRNGSRFFIQPLDGTKAPTLLFDGYGANGTLSPTGTMLLYTRENAPMYRKRYIGSESEQIWLYDLASKEHKLWRKDKFRQRWPMWGPGQRIYVSEESGTNNLVMGENQKLTNFKGDGVMFPAISRDGTTIVFRRLFDLYSLDINSRKVSKIELFDNGDSTIEAVQNLVETSATAATFTSDGRVMAFVSGNDIWTMDTVLKEPIQVTNTACEEGFPVFVDNDTLMYISMKGGNPDIWTAKKADDKKFFWQQSEFVHKKITNDPNVELNLRLMPDGKRVTYLRNRGDIMIMDVDGGNKRKLLSSWNMPDYDISSDSQWITYAVEDNDFNSDVWIARVDGKGEPFNLSCHPDYDGNPRFSADGTVLAFSGRRWGTESDIAYVYLTADKEEESSRDRRLEKAIKKMKERKKKAPSKSAPKKKSAPAKKSDSKATAKAKATKKPAAKKESSDKIKIDFVGIRDRLRRISVPNSSERGLQFMPKGAKLLFRGSMQGKRGVYSVEFPDSVRPKMFATSIPSGLTPLKDAGKMAGVMGGKPALMSMSGKSETFSFTGYRSLHLGKLSAAIFRQAWLLMRDNFYDEKLGNNNWDEIYRKYAPMAENCLDRASLSEVGNMMLGELNGSHLGFSLRSMPSEKSTTRKTWNEITGHLGCRFDPEWKGPGLKIKDVIRKTPAANKKSRLRPGEIIVSIDGQTVDPARELATVMTGFSQRDVHLLVKGIDGKERKVSIRPTTYASVRRQLYEEWLASNRAKVDKMSGGKLGYLHIRAMSGGNLIRFDEELYRIGHGKDGLIIDVRENGGGSITDHLLTCLTQPTHAITKPRGGGEGYPGGRRIYATWDKPILVLCNQNSFSNAEIFAHAVKTLKRGKVVGVRTAGGVISTGGRSIMGYGFVRMPFRGWYLMDGEDMELNGCAPDVELWPAPGDWPAGIDKQLEKAVELLGKDVDAWKAKPRPKLRKSSER